MSDHKPPHPDDPRVPPVQFVRPLWPSEEEQAKEPVTGSYLIPASMRDVKDVRAEVDQGLRLNEIKTVVAIVVASLGVVLGAWRVVLGDARAQTDAGVAPLAARQKILADDFEAHKREEHERHAAVLRKLERQDEKQDLILDALRVPSWKREPARPPGGDGGT